MVKYTVYCILARMQMKEIRHSYDETKKQSEKFDFWLYHVGRRFSWPVAWAAIKLGISPIAVTLVSIFFVWTGALLIAIADPLGQLIGALFFQLWLILDCADGTVARATNTGSLRGEYADALGAYSVSMSLYAAMGIAAARHALSVGAPPFPAATVQTAGLYVILGFGSSLMSLFARLIYQKHLVLHFRAESAHTTVKPRDERQNPVMVLAQNIAANSGFALPLSFVALATGRADWFVLLYAAVNGAMLALTLRRTFGRATPQLPPGGSKNQ